MDEQLVVIEDCNNVAGVVLLPARSPDIAVLNREYDEIMSAGPNPMRYNTTIQDAWCYRVSEREKFLVSLYGGICGGLQYDQVFFSPETFIGWLVKEKGAKKIAYQSFLMAEFD